MTGGVWQCAHCNTTNLTRVESSMEPVVRGLCGLLCTCRLLMCPFCDTPLYVLLNEVFNIFGSYVSLCVCATSNICMTQSDGCGPFAELPPVHAVLDVLKEGVMCTICALRTDDDLCKKHPSFNENHVTRVHLEQSTSST